MLSDAQLMQLIQAGQSGRFDELIVRHRPGLLRVARSMLPDADLAEDAVQEALLAAFAARATYDSRFAFSTWIYTILLNVCRRQRRRRQPAIATGGRFESAAPIDDSPLERLLQAEAREQLSAVLNKIPDVEADALRLRFFAGLAFEEIAAAMNSSVSGAKVRVRRGLERIAQRLSRGPETTSGTPTSKTTIASPPARRTEP